MFALVLSMFGLIELLYNSLSWVIGVKKNGKQKVHSYKKNTIKDIKDIIYNTKINNFLRLIINYLRIRLSLI